MRPPEGVLLADAGDRERLTRKAAEQDVVLGDGIGCSVCQREIGWDAPSGVCSSECLLKGQGFEVRPNTATIALPAFVMGASLNGAMGTRGSIIASIVGGFVLACIAAAAAVVGAHSWRPVRWSIVVETNSSQPTRTMKQ